MVDGNNNLTPSATAAIKRIRILREATRKTGFATSNEQAQVLTSLGDTDILAVADELAKDNRAIQARAVSK